MQHISVAETKSHLSEIISKSIHGHERFIITRRNKPVAALINLDDLKIIEQYQERQGLAAVASTWPDFEEVATPLLDLRRTAKYNTSNSDAKLLYFAHETTTYSRGKNYPPECLRIAKGCLAAALHGFSRGATRSRRSTAFGAGIRLES